MSESSQGYLEQLYNSKKILSKEKSRFTPKDEYNLFIWDTALQNGG